MKKYDLFLTVVLCSLLISGCTEELKKKDMPDSPVGKKTAGKEKKQAVDVIKEKSLLIEDVFLAKKTVDISKNEKAKISFSLTSPAEEVVITFYNSVNQTVREITFKDLAAGRHIVEWDGTGENSEPCETDVYIYVIKASRGEKSFTFNPAVNTGYKHLKVEEVNFIKNKMHLDYVLPKAAWVRIRIGIRESAMLKTLMEWRPMEAGRHTLAWDGWDKDNVIQFAKDPRVSTVVEAYSLASNSIIIKSSKTYKSKERLKQLAGGKVPAYPLQALSKVFVKEPVFTVTIPDTYPRNEQGLPVVSGKVPVRVTLSPEDKDDLINSRYELMYYVDMVFLYEDEQAYDPFTYLWDTKSISEGEHIFSVNLLGYNMSVGISSVRVFVKNN